MYNETLGKLHFWLFLIGFHLTFDFMHIPGILGMPRRIYTYEPGRGWDIWNLIVTIGVFFQAAGVLVFVGNLLWSYFRGRAGRERSLGRLDARMVHQFAAAGVQLRERSPRSGAGVRCGTSSIRKIPTGSTSKEPMSALSITIPEAPSQWSLPSRGRGRHVLPDRGRERDLHDLRGRLHLLYRQEPYGAAAERCSACSDLLHHLPAFEQPDDSLRRRGS